MARKIRTHIEAHDAWTDEDLRPKHLSKQEFGRRLYTLMLRRGWNQSELARQADIARDSVSKYVRGLSLPTPVNLDRLAAALEVRPIELLPNTAQAAIDEDVPALELKISTADSTVSYLRVNRLVSTTTAMQIVELLNADTLEADETADAS